MKIGKQDREKIRWFRGELRAYVYSESVVRSIESKIRLLDAKIGYHSPAFDSDHIASQVTHDEKLADYIFRKQKLEKELETINRQRERVEGILAKIKEKERYIILRTAKNSSSMESEAEKLGYTRRGLILRMDSLILRAVRLYEEGK